MARVDIVSVETPEGNAVRGGDPVTVSVTIFPSDTGWFDDKKYLVVGFVYADTLDVTPYLTVYKEYINVDNAATINFKVSAEVDASAGEYYVLVKNTHFKEIVVSGSGAGTITVS